MARICLFFEVEVIVVEGVVFSSVAVADVPLVTLTKLALAGTAKPLAAAEVKLLIASAC